MVVQPAGVQFWRAHFRLGLALSYLLVTAVGLRALLDERAARAPVLVAGAVALLTPALLLVPRDRLARTGDVRWLFYLWEAVGLVLVGVVVLLDGGIASPFIAFWFVLVAHTTLAFPPSTTLGYGLVAATATLAIGFAGPEPDPAAATVGALALATASLIAAEASRTYRRLLHRTETLAREATALADVDGLTGCLNHRAFHRAVEQATALARADHPVSVLVLDVDHFKGVNDSHGHPAGDTVLAELGRLLREHCRVDDVAGRLGGDEFGLLLPGVGDQAAHALARRLAAQLAAEHLPYATLASIGVATVVEQTPAPALIAAADADLYRHRRASRSGSEQGDG